MLIYSLLHLADVRKLDKNGRPTDEPAVPLEQLKQFHGGALPAELTLDLDATDDPTHGQQQLTLFHAFYDQHQYYPLLISEPTSKMILSAWLRHGTAPASLGADDDLLRVVQALRRHRSDIAIHVRADAGFATPQMYRVCEENHVSYSFGLQPNARLKAMAEDLLTRAVEQYRSTGQKQRLFTSWQHQAGSWDRSRQVLAKAECSAEGTNLRFVVSSHCSIDAAATQALYDDYVQRGESEQRFDELKNALHGGRLSCHRFMANFFRLLLHTAALNLLAAFRNHPAIPEPLRRARPQTWRSRIIKLAATVIRSTRRIVLCASRDWPFWELYREVAGRARFAPTPAG
jgi:hypothetical protein